MGVLSTNVQLLGVVSGSGGGGDFANGADLPTHLDDIAAQGGNHFALLLLTYINTDFVDGVRVCYSEKKYPSSPFDESYKDFEGAVDQALIEGLTNGVLHYFRVFLYRKIDNVQYFQTDPTNSKVTYTPVAVSITGEYVARINRKDVIVLTESCTDCVISAPAGTKFVLACGGDNGGGYGGSVVEYTLNEPVNNEPFSVDIAARRIANGTSMIIGDIRVDTGALGSKDIIVYTPWGPIGGKGGAGGKQNAGTAENGKAGTGAGGGGGGSGANYTDSAHYVSAGGLGGNSDNIYVQNYGGNGGRGIDVSSYGNLYSTAAQNGASGAGGATTNASGIGGSGGGGGFGAGGGEGGVGRDGSNARAGQGGAGVVVIVIPT